MQLDAADRWEASHTFRYNDCYAWCSKMCIALILVTEAWNSLPSGSCWQQACGTDTAQVSRHGWSWMGQLKLRMICLLFSTLSKLNYNCYRSRGAFRVPQLIQHLQLCHLALIEWHLTVREGAPSMQMLAKIIVFIESKSFPCHLLCFLGWIWIKRKKKSCPSVCTWAPTCAPMGSSQLRRWRPSMQ